ncbi:inovirus Gp2 family protein [Laribacter hongkongensis]|uniref:inovirus Gp2 family protein n=1 Tax=Laribacter hongkongensis TaxID=168471 RepID=UPI001EFD76FD|nr:inovirus Gp2 family protein [Laribacter hongkongensis]MCG9060184.1 inovirus Gp2 family protein [Laribacter hongkongensis]MCG9087273.1 inovirus Gp2 family protein [Laribacter hongkongensis]
MIRHPDNPNLSLWYHDNYKGLPVQTAQGPLITEYARRLYRVVQEALDRHPRTFAFRLDLRFPEAWSAREAHGQGDVMRRFMASFKARIRHNRDRARLQSRHAHDSDVRYVWAREYGQQGKPHYHVAILLNRDAFCSLGHFQPGRDNLFNRLVSAWGSALGLDDNQVAGLVELPEHPAYHLYRHDPGSWAPFFYRASYLCKSATKRYGAGRHGFGASRGLKSTGTRD